jgi:hypothetical protein
MRRLAAFFAPCLFAACGDLDVRSVRAPQVVPPALIGEWSGTWHADGSGNSGSIVVRVQSFEGEPVVNVQIENPCVEPRTYQLVVTPATFELRADGQTVLAATLGEGRELIGTYHCSAEDGTWNATWQHDLPEVLDLSGDWSGTLVVGGQSDRPLALMVSQSVDGGVVLLDGLLDLGDVWPVPVPLRGSVEFRDDGYEVVLSTVPGNQPVLLLTGIGDRDPLRIENGVLQGLGGQPLPFQSALFTIARQGP